MYVDEKIFTGSSEPCLCWKSLESQRKSHQFRTPTVCKVQPVTTYLWNFDIPSQEPSYCDFGPTLFFKEKHTWMCVWIDTYR